MNPIALLNHPLTLIGLLLFSVFSLFKLILKSGLLKRVTGKETAPILHKILNFGFVLALSVVVTGAGLEAYKIHKKIDQILQAKKAIIGEILTNIKHLDSRLTLFQRIFASNFISDQQWNNVRQRVAPGLGNYFDLRSHQTFVEQQIADFHQIINNDPLLSACGNSLLNDLRDSGINTEIFQRFYNQLKNVERVSENLPAALKSTVFFTEKPSKLSTEYSKRKLKIAKEDITIEYQRAYLYALEILHDVATGPNALSLPDSVTIVLESLQNLHPKKLINQKQTGILLSELNKQQVQVMAEKSSLVALAQNRAQEVLNSYNEVDKKLKINPTDTRGEVAGKAIALRNLGRTEEAMAVFSRYGEMFFATYPMDKHYVKVALQFTPLAGKLRLPGGTYVFEVKPDSNAQKVGLKAGDTIIEYNGELIGSTSILRERIRSSQVTDSVSITWLRLNPLDHFELYSKIIPGGTLGIGIRGI